MTDNIESNKIKKIALIIILVLTGIMIPFIVLAFLNIGGIPIFITLIVIVSIIAILTTIFIIFDLTRILKRRKLSKDNEKN